MKRKKIPALFLESSSDYQITNQDGETVSLDVAKSIYESGKLHEWNMAFGRLVAYNFDLEATKAYYNKGRA